MKHRTQQTLGADQAHPVGAPWSGPSETPLPDRLSASFVRGSGPAARCASVVSSTTSHRRFFRSSRCPAPCAPYHRKPGQLGPL
jgi:hypothetical protein